MRANEESPLCRHSIVVEQLKRRLPVCSIRVASAVPLALRARPATVSAKHMDSGLFDFTRTVTPESIIPTANCACQYCISNSMLCHSKRYFPSEVTLLSDVQQTRVTS